MSRPSAKITRTIRSEQVLNAFVEVVGKNLPLDLKNTRITADDIIYALAYANVHRLSIESACQELEGALANKTPENAQNLHRRVFLDKGFCSKSVFKVLNQHKVSYITPIPVRGKSGGVRSLFQGKSRKTSYTFNTCSSL